MKASELIKELQKQIKEYGDMEVVYIDDVYVRFDGVRIFSNILNNDSDEFKLTGTRIL